MSKTRICKSWRKKYAFSTWSDQLVCYALIKDGGKTMKALIADIFRKAHITQQDTISSLGQNQNL